MNKGIREWPVIRVRVPPELREKILLSAEGDRRSINSEIVLILERHYEQKEKAPEQGLENRSDASHAE